MWRFFPPEDSENSALESLTRRNGCKEYAAGARHLARQWSAGSTRPAAAAGACSSSLHNAGQVARSAAPRRAAAARIVCDPVVMALSPDAPPADAPPARDNPRIPPRANPFPLRVPPPAPQPLAQAAPSQYRDS